MIEDRGDDLDRASKWPDLHYPDFCCNVVEPMQHVWRPRDISVFSEMRDAVCGYATPSIRHNHRMSPPKPYTVYLFPATHQLAPRLPLSTSASFPAATQEVDARLSKYHEPNCECHLSRSTSVVYDRSSIPVLRKLLGRFVCSTAVPLHRKPITRDGLLKQRGSS
jgi:hypothetical protein